MSRHDDSGPSGRHLVLTLGDLAAGGDAVGRHEGRVIFVRGGAPGERVRVEITERRRSFWRGRVIARIQASAASAEAPCPVAGRCGGCQWQHVTAAEQVKQKRRLLEQALRHYDLPEAWSFQPAPREFGYRRRARLRWRVVRGRLVLGFRAWRGHEIVDIATCPALLPVLNEALEVLRHGLLAYDRGAEGSAVLLADESAAVCHLSVLVDRGPALGPEGFLKHPIMGAVVFDRSGAVERAGAEGVSLGEAGIRGSADAFAQAQIEQDAWLRGRVSAWSDATAPQRIVELFAGGGNLTRVLAAPGREVVAVELSPSSLVWLERNVVGLPGRIEVRAGRAEVELEAISGAVDLVVLDPPREGARDVMSHIARLRPKAVIYVSCDPMTLARDLTILGEAGYRIESLWGLDMMPQTYHVEAAVWLTLSGT